MKLDKDALISLLIGILLISIALGWKFWETGDLYQTLVGILVETVRGGIFALGVLFIIVGILFVTAW